MRTMRANSKLAAICKRSFVYVCWLDLCFWKNKLPQIKKTQNLKYLNSRFNRTTLYHITYIKSTFEIDILGFTDPGQFKIFIKHIFIKRVIVTQQNSFK